MFDAKSYPITIAETAHFQRTVKKILTEEELSELIGHVAFNPTGGDLMPDTGGLRKLRWRLSGHGTRSGARIIYFFYDLNMPLYLLAAYSKSEKIDLTKGEKKEMRQLAKALVRASYSRRMNRKGA